MRRCEKETRHAKQQGSEAITLSACSQSTSDALLRLTTLFSCPPLSSSSSTPRTKQGIDLEAGGRNKTKHRTAPKSDNVYLKLLVKVRLLFSFFDLIARKEIVGRRSLSLSTSFSPSNSTTTFKTFHSSTSSSRAAPTPSSTPSSSAASTCPRPTALLSPCRNSPSS